MGLRFYECVPYQIEGDGDYRVLNKLGIQMDFWNTVRDQESLNSRLRHFYIVLARDEKDGENIPLLGMCVVDLIAEKKEGQIRGTGVLNEAEDRGFKPDFIRESLLAEAVRVAKGRKLRCLRGSNRGRQTAFTPYEALNFEPVGNEYRLTLSEK